MKPRSSRRRLWTAAACLWLAASGRLSAQEVVAVLSSKLEYYRTAFEAFQKEIGRPVPVFTLPEEEPRFGADTRVVVAFGTKAASKTYSRGVILVHCLAPAFHEKSPRMGGAIRISMMPRADFLLAKLRQLQPGLARLLIFWVSDEAGAKVLELERTALPLGITILNEKLDASQDLPERLRALKMKPDALWLAPDPFLVNEVSFAILKEYSIAQKVPFYAPSDGFAEKGAPVAISASFSEIGRTTALATQSALTGKSETPVFYPQQLTVTVNLSVAEKCGLDIPASALETVEKVLP